MDVDSTERERQRVAHLVLGEPRPARPAVTTRKGKKRAAGRAAAG